MYCTKCGEEIKSNVVASNNGKKKLVSKKVAVSSLEKAFSLSEHDANFLVGVYTSNKDPKDVANEIKCDNADIIKEIQEGNFSSSGNDFESNFDKTKRYRNNLLLISLLEDFDKTKESIENPKFCPSCGNPYPSEFGEKERKELSLTAHRLENVAYDRTQNALCFVVIGGILLIVGIIFFILSFKSQVGRMGRYLTPNSFEFVVSVAGLGSGIVLLIIGLVRFFKARKLKKNMHLILEKLKENFI